MESVLVVSLAVPPPEILPPRSPYSYDWWEEEEIPQALSLDGPMDEEAMFRLLIEEVLKGYESFPKD